MNKSVLITGVSGTGKSSVCDELNRRHYKSFGIEDIHGMFTMMNRKTHKPFKNLDNSNLEMVKEIEWFCDKNKLQKLMRENSKGVVFYCGIASNIDDLLPLFDKTFLLRASEKTLGDRLSKRTSHDFGRTREVQEWIFGWKDWWEKHMIEKGAIVIDANRPLKDIAKEIIEKIK